ncbi:hypothetical protein UMM65_17080 [Aureibaculum sp. 2210JD6-5]|uniref:hypothetical protein n=1 Tax=Aureibaculum sp. 2210JD6-5 TaxID=3103957 RepID=UPI002AAD5CD6|nr:hypothetical protein [Aureibaculum sp. 2210JD6-5]MDY7396963.1 hypothetical protein [Aureibaculum sp. 2210JD6-5]
MYKKWIYNTVYGIVAEHTDHLFFNFRLIDQNDKEIGQLHTSKKPSMGDKIILDDTKIRIKPKMFVVKQVYLSQSSFTGILMGKIKELDSNHYQLSNAK